MFANGDMLLQSVSDTQDCSAGIACTELKNAAIIVQVRSGIMAFSGPTATESKRKGTFGIHTRLDT